MKPTYFAILTAKGEKKLTQATANQTTLKLTEMAVGDGKDILPIPDRAQTRLIHEQRRAPINTLFVDSINPHQLIAEQIIPEDVGGWWIREIGLFDEDGDLCAVANCPPTYKPKLAEGAGRTQIIRLVLALGSADAVELKIDPSIVLATREYVEQALQQAQQQETQQQALQMIKETFAPIQSPVFTGAPTAPTPTLDNDSEQLATTAFVQAVGQRYAFPERQTNYQILPNGLIFQWGTVIMTMGNSQWVTFPISFSDASFHVWMTDCGGGCNANSTVTQPDNPTGFNAFGRTSTNSRLNSTTSNWLAIGY